MGWVLCKGQQSPSHNAPWARFEWKNGVVVRLYQKITKGLGPLPLVADPLIPSHVCVTLMPSSSAQHKCAGSLLPGKWKAFRSPVRDLDLIGTLARRSSLRAESISYKVEKFNRAYLIWDFQCSQDDEDSNIFEPWSRYTLAIW